jgi:hypothetical protein
MRMLKILPPLLILASCSSGEVDAYPVRGYYWYRGHYSTQYPTRRSPEQWNQYSPGLRNFRRQQSPYR